MARRTKGRQKIQMEKMKNESNLQVTFSKRRSGLFKKASELCTLCGVDIAIIVFSPGQKAFSFGHPNVEAIIDRFLANAPPQAPSAAMHLVEAHRNANVRELNVQLTRALDQLEVEKRRGEELKQAMNEGAQGHWWESSIDELNLSQLEQLKYALDVLKGNITKKAEQILMHPSNPPFLYPSTAAMQLPPPPPPPSMQYLPGASSNNGPIMPQSFDANNDGFNTNMMPHMFRYGYSRGLF